jgi:molybdenum cofactor biosynthesis enzyme MoaA
MSFCAVNDKLTSRLQVIWDLGRRCTYACSYCPPHRRNNWSELASMDELIKAAHQIDRYAKLHSRFTTHDLYASISFTGGEPTINPIFFDFLEYTRKNLPDLEMTLTTNGCFSERKCMQVIEHTYFSTVSYHTEATDKQKAVVKNNLSLMKKHGYGFKVNVMFHEDKVLFQECVDLCAWLDENGIEYTPRIIGDDGDVQSGLKNKTIHTYSDEQLNWYKEFWRSKKQKVSEAKKVETPDEGTTTNATAVSAATAVATAGANSDVSATNSDVQKPDAQKPKEKKTLLGQSVGRPCCGGRPLNLLYEDKWENAKFVPTNNFQGWSCMVNWYFLYIHQEIGDIWFHQTCQVNLNGEVAPISTINEFDKFIDGLETQMNSGKMPYIRCPKKYCGCGLCAPKARSDEMAYTIFKEHVPKLEPVFMAQKEITNPITLRRAVENYDALNSKQPVPAQE